MATTGAIVQVNRTEGDGGEEIYDVQQLALQPTLPPPVRSGLSHHFEFGPIALDVVIDIDRREIEITVSVLGITLGTFYGSFDKGIGINVNLFLVTGSLNFYIKNGNELWVRIDLDVKFDGSYHEDKKIFGW